MRAKISLLTVCLVACGCGTAGEEPGATSEIASSMNKPSSGTSVDPSTVPATPRTGPLRTATFAVG